MVKKLNLILNFPYQTILHTNIYLLAFNTSHLNTRKTRAQLFMFDFCQLILKYHVRFHFQLIVIYIRCVCVNREEFSNGRLLLYIYMKKNCTKDNNISTATCPVDNINKYFQINSEKFLDP